jgi:hypothetical protein
VSILTKLKQFGLNEKFWETHNSEVNKAMKDSGMTGGAKDFDYKTYNGVGKPPPAPSGGEGAAPADTYPYNYTAQRQMLGGKTTVYTPDKGGIKVTSDGKVEIKSYQTSGEALVDADALSKGRMTGGMPPAPGKVGYGELPDVIRMQLKSATEHADLKSVAKALDRASDSARRLNIHNPELDKLSELAASLKRGTQSPEALNALKNANLTEAQFIEKTRSMLNQLDKAAPDAAKQMLAAAKSREAEFYKRAQEALE